MRSYGAGIFESQDTSYNDEEKKIFEVNSEVKKLINELEFKEKKIETKTQQET